MRRYVIPLLDQCVVAAFNLALQLALIRLAPSEDYGTFVLWQSMVMIMVGFQDAMIGMPLSLRIAYQTANRRRLVVERQVAGFAVVFIAVGAGLILAGAFGVHDGHTAQRPLALSAALFAATFLAYYAVRFLAQSRAAFGAALVMDSAYAVLSLGLLAGLYFAGLPFTVPVVFTGLSVPAALSAILGALLLPHFPRPRARRALHGYRGIWRDSRWTVAAVTAAELQNRAFIFVITAFYGAAALAGVFAGMLVLRHLTMVTLAWTAFARPFLVQMRERGEDGSIVRFAAVSAAVLMVGYGLNLAVLALAWPLVETYIYANYSDMWPVVELWTLIYTLQVPVTVLALMLVTFGRYREDSLAVMAGSAFTLVLVVTLAALYGPRLAILGMGVGYAVTAAIMGWRVARTIAARRAARG